MKPTPNKIIAQADNIDNKIYGSPRGISCIFVPLDSKWAIKLFTYNSERDETYKRQKLAAKHNLGPKVGDTVDLPISSIYRYGYVTEIITPLTTMSSYDSNISDEKIEEWERLEDEYYNAIMQICDDLQEIGISFGDCHAGNVGWKNGKLMCLDFGE